MRGALRPAGQGVRPRGAVLARRARRQLQDRPHGPQERARHAPGVPHRQGHRRRAEPPGEPICSRSPGKQGRNSTGKGPDESG